MKTSNKALLGTVVAIVGLIFAGIVAARISVEAMIEKQAQIQDTGPKTTRR
jgi:hypothetical protein